MSVIEFSSGDKFVIRLIKYHSANPNNKWANTYEFRATETGGTGPLNALASSIVLFEQALHMTFVKFDHYTISTWEEDSVPYDPEAFISTPLTVSGLRGGLADGLPLNQAYAVRRVPSAGRFGHLFYRGCLLEDDVSSPAGKQVLDDPEGLQESIDTALESSELGLTLGAALDGGFQMVMINKDGTQIRPVVTLTASGVSAVPQDHAWFNRTPAS